MANYHNRLIIGFVTSNPKMVVYLKQSEETREYAVKVMHHDGTKTVVFKTYSLSSALRELAETVAQFTDGFTTWKEL
jgi:hypothetical protein